MTPEQFADFRDEYQSLKDAPHTEDTDHYVQIFQQQFALCETEAAINEAQVHLRNLLYNDGSIWPKSASASALIRMAIMTLGEARASLINDYVTEVET